MSKLIRLTVVFYFFYLSSCGISIGTGTATLNDPIPKGSLVAQGQLAGVNAKSVSGTAQIYNTSGSSVGFSYNYTLRLDSLTAPDESNLVVQLYATPGGKIFSQSLKGASGSQNYQFTAPGSVTFNNVYIYSTTNNIAYGTAVLQ
jgi:hypothetical protein